VEGHVDDHDVAAEEERGLVERNSEIRSGMSTIQAPQTPTA